MSRDNFDAIKINHSINEIMKDMKNTSDPIKRAILQKFMDIKIRELRRSHSSSNNDVLIDILSEADNSTQGSKAKQNTKPNTKQNVKPNVKTNAKINTKQNVKQNAKQNTKQNTIQSAKEITKENAKLNNGNKKNTKQDEINEIIKRQNQGLSDLDKFNKIQAYNELIQDNDNDNDKNKDKDKAKDKNKDEKPWNNNMSSDPKYSKFMKEDSMNNKLMERLNSEIDFRGEEHVKMPIEKPFEDDDYGDNITDTFARFEAPEEPLPRTKRIVRQKYN